MNSSLMGQPWPCLLALASSASQGNRTTPEQPYHYKTYIYIYISLAYTAMPMHGKDVRQGRVKLKLHRTIT